MKHYYFLKKDKNNFEVYLNYHTHTHKFETRPGSTRDLNNAHLPVTSTHTHTHTILKPGWGRPGIRPTRDWNRAELMKK
jgi:hypothetical protein